MNVLDVIEPTRRQPPSGLSAKRPDAAPVENGAAAAKPSEYGTALRKSVAGRRSQAEAGSEEPRPSDGRPVESSGETPVPVEQRPPAPPEESAAVEEAIPESAVVEGIAVADDAAAFVVPAGFPSETDALPPESLTLFTGPTRGGDPHSNGGVRPNGEVLANSEVRVAVPEAVVPTHDSAPVVESAGVLDTISRPPQSLQPRPGNAISQQSAPPDQPIVETTPISVESSDRLEQTPRPTEASQTTPPVSAVDEQLPSNKAASLTEVPTASETVVPASESPLLPPKSLEVAPSEPRSTERPDPTTLQSTTVPEAEPGVPQLPESNGTESGRRFDRPDTPPADSTALAGQRVAETVTPPHAALPSQVAAAGRPGPAGPTPESASVASSSVTEAVPPAALPQPTVEPAAESTTAAQKTAPEVAQRVEQVQRVSDAIRTAATTGPRELRIRLHPPELGALQVEIVNRDGGRLVARLSVETPAAHAVLSEQLPSLTEHLAGRGHVVERIDVVVTEGDDRTGRDVRTARSDRESDARDRSGEREQRRHRDERDRQEREPRQPPRDEDEQSAN